MIDLADEPDPAVVDGCVGGRSVRRILASGDLDHATGLAGREDVDAVEGRRVSAASGDKNGAVVVEPRGPRDIKRATAAVGTGPAGRKVVDPEFRPGRGQPPEGQLGPVRRPGRVVGRIV